MATPPSRTVPSSPNSSVQGSSRTRDWNNHRTAETSSAFRGIGRGRGGIKGGRGGGHPSSSGQKGGGHPDTVAPSPSSTMASVSRKPSTPTSNAAAPSSLSGNLKAVNGSVERNSRPKSGSRKQVRATPAVVVPTSPPQTSQTAPPTPSRSHRQRHPQQGKGPTATMKPLALRTAIRTKNSRALPSQTALRKDVPPHLAAAHEAEVRHDIDVLVERVRAVAMAENRPTTPGSHIDWAGDEDGSLPDLDDWGVTTTHTDAPRDDGQSEEISPILADTLKRLPEPNSEVHQGSQEMESYDVEPEQTQKSSTEPSFMFNHTEEVDIVLPTIEIPEQGIIVPALVENSSSHTISDGKHPLHPSLPSKPVAAMESLRARGRSTSKPSDLPSNPPVFVAEEDAPAANTEGLSESIHALSMEERLALERVSSASPSERGLTASIHAPVPGLPESRSAPNILSTHTQSTSSRAHSRSQTEGRSGVHQLHTSPPATASHRHGRSGASSPLGKHVYTHSRNHSTPAGGASSRLPQASRPVITGEAISRLARTIGGIGPTPRTQAITVTKDSTIPS